MNEEDHVEEGDWNDFGGSIPEFTEDELAYREGYLKIPGVEAFRINGLHAMALVYEGDGFRSITFHDKPLLKGTDDRITELWYELIKLLPNNLKRPAELWNQSPCVVDLAGNQYRTVPYPEDLLRDLGLDADDFP